MTRSLQTVAVLVSLFLSTATIVAEESDFTEDIGSFWTARTHRWALVQSRNAEVRLERGAKLISKKLSKETFTMNVEWAWEAQSDLHEDDDLCTIYLLTDASRSGEDPNQVADGLKVTIEPRNGKISLHSLGEEGKLLGENNPVKQEEGYYVLPAVDYHRISISLADDLVISVNGGEELRVKIDKPKFPGRKVVLSHRHEDGEYSLRSASYYRKFQWQAQ